jgi:hypothetical protein
MANWTVDKPAHVDTWLSLFRLGQLRKPFNASGRIKMSELTFYNPTMGSDSLKVEATLIANTIDRVFTSWGAQLENNISRITALNEMIKVLLDKDKTILELAEKNDENYFYVNEIK